MGNHAVNARTSEILIEDIKEVKRISDDISALIERINRLEAENKALRQMVYRYELAELQRKTK
jgi:uncharacterized protein (UPF0335 family)